MNPKMQKEKSHIKLVLNLPQEPKLKNYNEYVPLQNIAIYNTWKKITKQYKNNKFKIIAPTWND